MSDDYDRKMWIATKILVVIAVLALCVTTAAWVFPFKDSQAEALNSSTNPMAPEEVTEDISITGTWNFQYSVSRSIDSNGVVKTSSKKENRVFSLKAENGVITGNAIGSSNQNTCKNLTLQGTTDGSALRFELDYSGSCCGGAQTIFEGEITGPISIEGKHSPAATPPPSCTLWWADVIATKM